MKNFKILSLIIAMVIVSTFLGCKRTNHTAKLPEKTETALSVVGDKYYLNFAGGNSVVTEDSIDSFIDASIELESLSQLKSKILNVNFTKEEENHIKKYFPKNDNGILMCDPNNLYEPQIENIEITGITWLGNRYTFYFENNDYQFNGTLACMDENDFALLFESRYAETFLFDDDEMGIPYSNIDSIEYDEKSGKTTYRLKTRQGCAVCRVRYTIESENKELFVEERYELNCQTGLHKVSEKIPDSVRIYGIQDGAYFRVSLYPRDKIIPNEFITSVGVRPYIDLLDKATIYPDEQIDVPADIVEIVE